MKQTQYKDSGSISALGRTFFHSCITVYGFPFLEDSGKYVTQFLLFLRWVSQRNVPMASLAATIILVSVDKLELRLPLHSSALDLLLSYISGWVYVGGCYLHMYTYTIVCDCLP